MDRKTARRCAAAAEAEGLTRVAELEALSDELIGAVVAAVRPARPNGHCASWELLAHQRQITRGLLARSGHDPLSIVKIKELLARQGCRVPYRPLGRPTQTSRP